MAATAGGVGLAVANEELDTSVKVSFKWALRSAAAAVSDSLNRSRLLLLGSAGALGVVAVAVFLELLFFLLGAFEWHKTQSHLPRGT